MYSSVWKTWNLYITVFLVADRSWPANRDAAVGRQRSVFLSRRHCRRSGGKEWGPTGAAGARYAFTLMKAIMSRLDSFMVMSSLVCLAQLRFILYGNILGFRKLCCFTFHSVFTTVSMVMMKWCEGSPLTKLGWCELGWTVVCLLSQLISVWCFKSARTSAQLSVRVGPVLLLINN